MAEVAPLVAPMVWRRVSQTTGDLTIPPEVGDRVTLKDIFILGGADGDYIDITVGGVAKLRLLQTYLDLHMVQALAYTGRKLGILGILKELIPDFPELYAAHDENLVIHPSATYTQLDAYYTREPVPDPDVKTLPGGSQAVVNPYIYWLTHGVLADVDGDYPFDTAWMQTGMRTLVSGGKVQATEQFDLWALILANETASTDSHLDRIKFMDEQTPMFTPEDAAGLSVDPDIGNELKLDLADRKIFLLDEAYLLGRDHRYTIEMTYDFITASRAAGQYKLGLVGIHRVL